MHNIIEPLLPFAVDIDSINQLVENPMSHDDQNIAAIMESLTKYGQRQVIVVNTETNQIEAGNGRWEAAKSLNWDQVAAVFVKDDPETALGYAITDNRTAQLATWNNEVLAAAFEQMDDPTELPGVEEDFMKEVFAHMEGDGEGQGSGHDDEPDEDNNVEWAKELLEKWEVKEGQVWVIPSSTVKGRAHVVYCGDSSKPGLMEVFGVSSKPTGIITDPPYGMNLDVTSSDLGRGDADRVSQRARNYKPVHGDDEDFDPSFIFEFYGEIKEVFLWGADYFAEFIPNRNDGSWLTWDKREGVEDMEFSLSSFELCWSKARHRRDIIRQRWVGVLGMESQDTNHRYHPTQKPWEVFAWIMNEYFQPNDTILDLFLGSGSSIVAAEKNKMIVLGADLEPLYVAVILERLTKMGLQPELRSNGNGQQGRLFE